MNATYSQWTMGYDSTTFESEYLPYSDSKVEESYGSNYTLSTTSS